MPASYLACPQVKELKLQLQQCLIAARGSQSSLADGNTEGPGSPPSQASQRQPPRGHAGPSARKEPLLLVPKELLQGNGASQYVPSPDGYEENLLILLHGLGDRPVSAWKQGLLPRELVPVPPQHVGM